jgi:hypothetical protein
MAGWDEVREIALALPEAEERPLHGHLSWRVRGKLFVWERPLREKERAALGDAAPEGPILGARVEGPMAKEALIADEPGLYFTTPHFDGHPSVLVRLERIGRADLEGLIAEAWLSRAPKRLARSYLDGLGGGQASSSSP